MHGDPNLGVDNYLLTGLETIGVVKNNYRPSASYVIDDRMYGFIRDMAHDIQNEIDTADGFNWRKWNEETIAERAIMADTVTQAAYLTAIHMNMQSYKDNPENFKKFNGKNKAGGVGNANEARTLYRGDKIPPDQVFKDGFIPKGSGNNLYEHIGGTPNNFISTSSDASTAQIYAGGTGKTYVYEINTSNYIDVNSTFGTNSLYPLDSEFSVPGGIPSANIRGAWVVQDGVMTDVFIPNTEYTGGR